MKWVADPYEKLSSAIVEQAADDYRCELAKLELNPRNGRAALEVYRLEQFFHSDWFGMLTDLDPDRLMEGTRILAKKEAAEKRVRLDQRRVRTCLKTVGEILGKLEIQDELSDEQQSQVRGFCMEALSLTGQIQELKSEAKTYGKEAARHMGLGTGGAAKSEGH